MHLVHKLVAAREYGALSALSALVNALTSAPRLHNTRALLRAEFSRVGYDTFVESMISVKPNQPGREYEHPDQQKARMLVMNQVWVRAHGCIAVSHPFTCTYIHTLL